MRTVPKAGGSTEAAREVDLLVVGGGAGGMTAALVAALQGLRVVLCEASSQVGGTTATSAGTIWVPGNRHGEAAGHGDSVAEGRRYLDTLLGSDDPRGLRAAYLDSAGDAIDYLERHSQVAFTTSGKHPDYLDLPGAAIAGRALSAREFDGRLLGADFARIRPPIAEFLLLGGMMANKTDVQALLQRFRSVRHFAHAVRLVLRYAADRLRYPRGTRLVMGNALVARLFLSLRNAGVEVLFDTALQRLETEHGRVVGARLAREGATQRITARAGVVLATGGIGHHPELSRALAPPGAGQRSLAHACVRGDGIVAAQQVGASLDRHPGSFFWQPVSDVAHPRGLKGLFPHLYLDRAKPGIIAVNAAGQRFVNEGVSYHHFVEAMLNAAPPAVPAYLVCSADFVRRYGLGVIAPGTRRLQPWVKRGYIVSADTLDALAARLGIDATGLTRAVQRFNRHAAQGQDPDFGKGDTELNRFNGDPAHGPNPCLGVIGPAPFCALAIWPADAASSSGLATDADGRVLGANGAPIAGLYACGNDMASIMQGAYPGPGTTIGPAMVFGYRAARHAAAARQSAGQATEALVACPVGNDLRGD